MGDAVSADWFERVWFLPDRWLRRVDMIVALLSMVVLIHAWSESASTFTVFLDDEWMPWGITALMASVLWATNGSAYMARKLKRAIPGVFLWMALRAVHR